MTKGDIPEKVLESFDESRRSFLKKLIIGSAFVLPAVTSFSMGSLGVDEAFAGVSNQVCVALVSNQILECKTTSGKPGDFSGCDFAGADLSGQNLSCLVFEGANFAGADLSNANLSFAVLTGANLSDASLTGADLTGANLAGANLSGADLRGAILKGANLKGTNFFQSNRPPDY